MRSEGARFKAAQAANIRCNASCSKKNFVFSFSDPGQSQATLCILRFFDSSSSRVYCDNATKVMCVANVIFGQERLTEQFLSMHFFYDSVVLFT